MKTNPIFSIFLILLLLVLVAVRSSGQQKADVFIWAGQSNAQGWMGDATFYPEGDSALDASILLNWTFVDHESSNGKWETMHAQSGRFESGHFGPEVSFSRELKKAGYSPAIFKYTKGGTSLARDWKAPGQGGIYDQMVRDLTLAISQLTEQGYEVHLQGFVWIQGESDAGSDVAAQAYHTNLQLLLDDLRTNALDEPTLSCVLGVDEQHPFVKERPIVTAAQQKLAEEDETIVYSSMLGLPKADATHLSPEGLIQHGRRIFEAYRSIDSKDPYEGLLPDTVKVITYNIWNGFDWGSDTLRQRQFRKWMKMQQPTLVALQELCDYTEEKLAEDARSWGHDYAVLLKTNGYSVGLTSSFPIRVKEKIRDGMHHGALHCESAGIDFLVVHLHPGSIQRRREEADILKEKLKDIQSNTSNYMVLGDFNAHSPIDADLYTPDGYFLNRLLELNKGKGVHGNILMNEPDYSVMATFLAVPLYDVLPRFSSGMQERGSFPGRILGKVTGETVNQLVSRMERIDYILVSPALKKQCVDARVENGFETWFLSDHYPVVARFIQVW